MPSGQPPKKSNRGLLIGVLAAAVIVVAAVVVVFVVTRSGKKSNNAVAKPSRPAAATGQQTLNSGGGNSAGADTCSVGKQRIQSDSSGFNDISSIPSESMQALVSTVGQPVWVISDSTYYVACFDDVSGATMGKADAFMPGRGYSVDVENSSGLTTMAYSNSANSPACVVLSGSPGLSLGSGSGSLAIKWGPDFDGMP